MKKIQIFTGIMTCVIALAQFYKQKTLTRFTLSTCALELDQDVSLSFPVTMTTRLGQSKFLFVIFVFL